MRDVAMTVSSGLAQPTQHPPLHLAAVNDNSALVRRLLAAGHSVRTCDSHGNTALHVAAAHGANAALRTLLQEATQTTSAPEDASVRPPVRSNECKDDRTHVDATNATGWTPLMQAARYGRSSALDLLLEFGANVSLLSCMDTNVLSLAAASGDVASVRSLIRAGASATAGQVSATVVAAQSGDEAVLRLLLDRGASANSPVLDTGVTPLMAAALCPSLACAQLLLSWGADPNLLSAAGTPAVSFAALSEDALPVFQLLYGCTTSVSQAIPDSAPSALKAVCMGDLGALHAILAQDREQAKAVNSDGVTALMAASVLGLEQAALVLLQLEADPNAVEAINGWSPLMHALYNGHVNIAQHLLRHNADIFYVSPKGHTIFDFAAQISSLEIAKAYIRAMSKEDTALPVPDSAPQSASNNHGIKKWLTKMSDRPQRRHSVYSDGLSLLRVEPGRSLWTLLCGCWLQRARGEKDLSNMVGCPVSSSDDYITPPPVPPIVGEPILPNLPHRPPQPLLSSISYEEDDFYSRSLRLCSPISDLINASLKWDSAIFSGTAARELSARDAAPRRSSTQRLVNRINRERSSESEWSAVCSSDTASTGTTVQTQRNAHRQHRDARSAAEELTMSLGARKVSEVLQKLALHQHTGQFEQEDVDFEAFLELTPDDVKELGVTDPLARLKILRAIQSLRKKV